MPYKQRTREEMTPEELEQHKVNGKLGGRPRHPRVHETSETLAALSESPEASRETTLAVIPPEDLPDHLQGLPDTIISILCGVAKGLTHQAVADRHGISRSRVTNIVQTYDKLGVFVSNPSIRSKLAEHDWQIVQARAQSLVLDKLEAGDKVSLQQAAVVAGVAADKLHNAKRLAQQQQIVEHQTDNSALAGLKAIDVEIIEPDSSK